MLSDFYDDTSTILVLDKENTKKINNFQLEDYTVSLYQKDILILKRKFVFYYRKANKRINLQPISSELRNIKYIHTLFEKEVPKIKKHLQSFIHIIKLLKF